MSTSEQQQPQQKKTIKLVVSPQYHSLGYQDYTAVHDVSDPLSILKSAGSSTTRPGEITLLFRGRKITPEEEDISFETLMKKVFCSLSMYADFSIMSMLMKRFLCFMAL
jgi:hypothetical protein